MKNHINIFLENGTPAGEPLFLSCNLPEDKIQEIPRLKGKSLSEFLDIVVSEAMKQDQYKGWTFEEVKNKLYEENMEGFNLDSTIKNILV